MRKFILKSVLKWLLFIALSFFVLFILLAFCALSYKKKYSNKIYPGIKIGQLDLSGKNLDKAEKDIQKMADKIIGQEIYFRHGSSTIPVSPLLTSATDPSLVKELFAYNVTEMAKSAYSIGREKKSIGENFFKQVSLLLKKENLLPIYNLNENEILEILKANFSSIEKRAKNAELIISGDYEIKITDEEDGYKFNYEKATLDLIKKLDNFSNTAITINLLKNIEEPAIKKEDIMSSKNEALALLETAPFNLSCEKQEWIITKEIIKDWIVLDVNLDMAFGEEIKFNYITLNKESVAGYLETNIAPKINIEPLNAKFEIKDGKVIEFQTSKDGIKLNLEKNYEYIREKIINYNEKNIELITSEVKADVTTDNVNGLGIKEIIGSGESNFAGSPKNRRHNIKTGADKINGILINQGEEFSLVTTLGKIDKESGYLPELVIKGNRTIPEYGGGLCQIGTTLFRTAINTGLPITERRNHSYRVSYYEPAGTDATIYSPKPDVMFINDTKHTILIQTKIEGNILIFEFWGTTDGRIVEKTEPKIENITKPGPTKIIETEDLKPGEKKCTERSHNGADASFTYKVIYANGTEKEEEFKSHYRPWRAVCLVGKENTASSTKETIE